MTARFDDEWVPVGYGSLRRHEELQYQMCLLPAGFADRLEHDLEGLRQEAAEQTARCRGALTAFSPLRVEGRLALCRIERLPDGALPGVAYAAVLIVVLDAQMALQLIATCWEPHDTADPHRVEDTVSARTRERAQLLPQMAEQILANAPSPGRETAGAIAPRPCAPQRPGSSRFARRRGSSGPNPSRLTTNTATNGAVGGHETNRIDSGNEDSSYADTGPISGRRDPR